MISVPGLRYVPDWLDAVEQGRLAARIDAAAWSGELRRRVQHYGHRYDYGRRGVSSDGGAAPAPPIPEWALPLVARLHGEGHMETPADQMIVNEYLPGQGISAHVDCVPCFGPVVVSVSLLSAVTMEFTDPDAETRIPVRLEPGSLCVMTGPARYAWRHAIAARKSDPGPHGRIPRSRRVSLTLRTVLPDEPVART
ncbi:alpha-ketoglutarate-dependent dioxygenase AlkB [Actinoallomurus acanthiterrae]